MIKWSNMNITPHHQFFEDNLSPKRLVFQSAEKPHGEVENFTRKEQITLNRIGEQVEESGQQRLNIMKDLNQRLSPIQEENRNFQTFLEEMNSQLHSQGLSQLTKTFYCLGEDIEITMQANGQYEAKNNQQLIEFLPWALQKKQKNLNNNAQI